MSINEGCWRCAACDDQDKDFCTIREISRRLKLAEAVCDAYDAIDLCTDDWPEDGRLAKAFNDAVDAWRNFKDTTDE